MDKKHQDPNHQAFRGSGKLRAEQAGHNEQSAHTFIMSQRHEVTGEKTPVHHITQNGQKNDNGTIANSRSTIHDILLAFRAVEKGRIDKLSSQELS